MNAFILFNCYLFCAMYVSQKLTRAYVVLVVLTRDDVNSKLKSHLRCGTVALMVLMYFDRYGTEL